MHIALRQELQSEITSRRSRLESLTTTAGLMMRGIQADSEAAQVLQDQLQEIKDRWNHVNEQVVELRLVTLAVMTSEVVYIRLFNSCRRLICNQ